MLWGKGRFGGPDRRYVALQLERSQLSCVLILRSCAADVLSSVEFDHTGRFLATGDKGGRIVIFENNGDVRTIGSALMRHLLTAV